MKKSTILEVCSIAGALVLATIGLILIVLNQLGSVGQLAHLQPTPSTIFIAYGCIFGVFFFFLAFGLLKAGSKKSEELHSEEVKAARVASIKAAIQKANKAAKAANDAAYTELLNEYRNS